MLEFNDLIGWAAALCVLLTFASSNMLTLRLFAISSNLLFIAYAGAIGLTPILILHALLLPINFAQLAMIIRRHRTVRRLTPHKVLAGPAAGE